MKRLALLLPLLAAGCATPMQASRDAEVEALRAEVKELRAEIKDAKNISAYKSFVRGKRVRRPKDRRNDLPKGVAR